MESFIRLKPGPVLTVDTGKGHSWDITTQPEVGFMHSVQVEGSVTFRDVLKIAKNAHGTLRAMTVLEHGRRLDEFLDFAEAAGTPSGKFTLDHIRLELTLTKSERNKHLTGGLDSAEWVGVGRDGQVYGLSLTSPAEILDVQIATKLHVRLMEDDVYSCNDGQVLAEYSTAEVSLWQLIAAAIDTIAFMEEKASSGGLLRDRIVELAHSANGVAAGGAGVGLELVNIPALATLDQRVDPLTLQKWAAPGVSSFSIAHLKATFCRHDFEAEQAIRSILMCPDNQVFEDLLASEFGEGSFLLNSEMRGLTGYELRKLIIDSELAK